MTNRQRGKKPEVARLIYVFPESLTLQKYVHVTQLNLHAHMEHIFNKAGVIISNHLCSLPTLTEFPLCSEAFNAKKSRDTIGFHEKDE